MRRLSGMESSGAMRPMIKLWNLVRTKIKAINAKFLPLEVSESDFRRFRENSPRTKQVLDGVNFQDNHRQALGRVVKDRIDLDRGFQRNIGGGRG